MYPNSELISVVCMVTWTHDYEFSVWWSRKKNGAVSELSSCIYQYLYWNSKRLIVAFSLNVSIFHYYYSQKSSGTIIWKSAISMGSAKMGACKGQLAMALSKVFVSESHFPEYDEN